MTTAKPQHANNQADAADDLIAELAKLMAQDAQGAQQQDRSEAANEDHARKAEPASANNTFAFRLPGDATPEPRLDTSETEKPAESSARPAAAQSQPQDEPEPASSEHDAIADLIEAELSEEPSVQQPDEPRAPEDSPASDRDAFKVAPVFGLSGPSSPIDAAPTRAAEPAAASAPARQPEPVHQAQTETPRDTEGADPLNAIESLIGDAVRTQVAREPSEEAPAEPAKADPSPALRSLATPVPPSAHQPDQESAVETDQAQAMSAEDAILAAAAATGAQVGWVDPQEGAAYIAEDERPRRAPRRNMRAFAGPAVALVALLVAGAGLYTVLGIGEPDGPPPVLTADAAPVKAVPEVQPTVETEPESVVFNEIAGTQTPAEDEQLVSRDQSQMASIAGSPPDTDATVEGLVNRKVRTVTVRPDGTIVGGEDALAGIAMLPVERPNVPEIPGAAPPDDTASIPATTAPATTGNAPAAAVNGAAAETAALTPGASALTGTPTATDAATSDAADAAVPAENLLIPGQPATAVDESGNEIAGRTAPVPMAPIERPSAPTGAPLAVATSPVNALVDPATQATATLPQPQPAATIPAATATQTAATQPAATTQAPAAPVDDSPDTLAELISAWSNDNREPVQPAQAAQPAATQTAATAPVPQAASQAPAYVQLSSQRSAAAAQQTVTNLQNRYGSLFGGTPLEVQQVDLGERGVYYRVRLPTQSLESATRICNSVKASGGDCFTL